MGIENKISDLLLRHEGLRLKPYKDTLGRLTIGAGRCLETKGISKAEALYMLRSDITDAINEAKRVVHNFDALSENRQIVLTSMSFNLGEGGLMKFRKMLTQIELGDFEEAAQEMLRSSWSSQVGKRAVELSEMMRIG